MPLETKEHIYLTGKEAAQRLGISHGYFHNQRSDFGDDFLQGRYDVMPCRVFFRLDDVDKLAAERAAR